MDFGNLYLRRIRGRLPETPTGWLFFALAVVFLLAGGSKNLWSKVTDNEMVQKILRGTAYAACVIFIILMVVADSKKS
ncbi:MAG: hypothetical protein J6B75_03495 [Ruminococcus sp.]|nr:hypothetical protein [Ruminococcus sp.]